MTYVLCRWLASVGYLLLFALFINGGKELSGALQLGKYPPLATSNIKFGTLVPEVFLSLELRKPRSSKDESRVFLSSSRLSQGSRKVSATRVPLR